MPKILNYTPSWISRPSQGSKIFTDPLPESSKRLSVNSTGTTNGIAQVNPYSGPRRLLAKRGDEIFIATGNQIRWTNLVQEAHRAETQKNAQAGKPRGASPGHGDGPSYRVLTVPVYQQIRQLIVSRSGSFVAILTEHTVHVAILPDPSHLHSADRSTLKLKTFQLGPTTHVLPQSPVVAALWHPLAVSTTASDCLVTVTADAAVRLWELDRNNQWTFDRPALAIDLTRLADGTSCNENFEPRGFGKSKGFSADVVDMEVASACFGGQGYTDEDGWAAMTLWVAMRTGDLYALCPLLPSRWAPTQTTLSSLTTSIVSEMADQAAESDDEEDDGDQLQQQYQWIQEIDDEEPLISTIEGMPDGQEFLEIRSRPSNPSPIPRLQGPFLANAEDEELELDLEVADIYVMASKLEAHEDQDELQQEPNDAGIPATVVCLTSSDRQLQICMSLDGVQGQWLPKKKISSFTVPASVEPKELIVVETLKISKPSKTSPKDDDVTNWPAITPDIYSRYDFFVTSSNSVNYFSLSSWASRLEKELTASSKYDNPDVNSSGLPFRLQLLCEDQITLSESLLIFDPDPTGASHLPACQLLQHEDIGYLLLTFTNHQAHALVLDPPHDHSQPDSSPAALFRKSRSLDLTEDSPEPDIPAPRPAYTPSHAFYAQPAASIAQIRSAIPARHRNSLTSEIRLSPSTLEILSSAHRALSVETNTIEKAAAELFRRVERLRNELNGQISQMRRVGERLQHMAENRGGTVRDRGEYDERIERVKEKQKQMTARYEELRKKVGRSEVLGGKGRELSKKEKEWVGEVGALARSFGVSADDEEAERDGRKGDRGLVARFDTLESLHNKLIPEAHALLSSFDKEKDVSRSLRESTPSPSPISRTNSAAGTVPPKLQKARIADAMEMVDREGAVIEAAMKRLERMSLGVDI